MNILETAAGRPLFHNANSVMQDVAEECSLACEITVERGPFHCLQDASQVKAGSEEAIIQLETAVLNPGSDILDRSWIISAHSPQYSSQDLLGSDPDNAESREGYSSELLASPPNSYDYDWSTLGSSTTSENCSSEPTPAEAPKQATTGATSMLEHFPWEAFDSALDAQDLDSCLQGWVERQSSFFQ